MSVTQDERWLRIETPLDQDELILTALQGEEAMSRLFSFELTMVSPRDSIESTSLLGKAVTIEVRPRSGHSRLFHGIVRRFTAGPAAHAGHRAYFAEVVPALWLLTRDSTCRFFQARTTPAIIAEVLRAHGIDFDTAGLRGAYRTREYCVQYRESDFDFISRLMEEDGIFYYFRHGPGQHTMVLADQRTGTVPCAEQAVPYSTGQHSFNVISEWLPAHEFRTGRWAQRDWDFRNAAILAANTSTVLSSAAFRQHEFYDYPGLYDVKADGDGLTRLRMEEEETGFAECRGASTCISFLPGGTFTLSEHDFASENDKGCLLTWVRHEARDESHFSGGGGIAYGNRFCCVPDTAAYRPPRRTRKPVVHGLQTAIVTGPAGEEIYCDEHGRIQVLFHWDRDARSSCWIRVAQMLSGPAWGGQFIPRVGMEVVVDFLEGDPDRPLVVGCVYNGRNRPPYALPANATQSGFKSRSSKGGGEANFNELRFEDKKGAEEVYLHAEKDFTRVVENDDTLTVERHRTATVTSGNDTLTVQQGDISITASLGAVSIEAMTSIDLKVGNSLVHLDQSGVTIKGLTIKVEGILTDVTGVAVLTLKGGIVVMG